MTKTAAILAGALLIAAGACKQGKSDPLIPDVAEIAAHAHAGDAEAQYELGKQYTIGVFVEEDDAEAVRWWRKAIEQGHAGAMHSLAMPTSTARAWSKTETKPSAGLRKQGKLRLRAHRDKSSQRHLIGTMQVQKLNPTGT